MAFKLNNSNEYEPIMVVLTKENTPKAYQAKMEEFVEQGCYSTIAEAEAEWPVVECECEIYYEKHSGVFAVESGAVESGTIYSPYTAEIGEDADTNV